MHSGRDVGPVGYVSVDAGSRIPLGIPPPLDLMLLPVARGPGVQPPDAVRSGQ